jgi:hypothetical protein
MNNVLINIIPKVYKALAFELQRKGRVAQSLQWPTRVQFSVGAGISVCALTLSVQSLQWPTRVQFSVRAGISVCALTL